MPPTRNNPPAGRKRTTKPVKKPTQATRTSGGSPPSTADVLRPVSRKQATTTRPVSTADVIRPTAKRTALPKPSYTDKARDAQRGVKVYEDGSVGKGKPYPTTRRLYPPKPAPLIKERPDNLRPPVSTGPIVGPPGEIRARTAGNYGYSDEARRALRDTPIHVQQLDEGISGQYRHDNALYINKDMPPQVASPTATHEMSHKRWFEDLDAQHPGPANDFYRDTMALQGGNPAIAGAVEDWQGATGFYENYYNNPNAGQDWRMAPTEIHARVAEQVMAPEQLPDWYRSKWYPQVWRPEDRRMGNQTPRFDREVGPAFLGSPDENGFYGKNWR